MVLKSFYAILLGVFLALFVGIGISTFYPQPLYQSISACAVPMGTPNNSFSMQQCQKEQQTYQFKSNLYLQIVSSIALVAAVIYFITGFIVFRNEEVFSYGFLFGSMFTLLYSILRGLSSNHASFTFILVIISLGIVMMIGYLRFVKS